ncbi:DUF6220 domain-containing protein [Lederbergia panacisoli]|uniref:DUF6220 domain-containing protein n=1 Tax=Lederbergia panacisoli TaxID=1255251 RepID=UPI00214AA0D4|nr:DUF6220 domain-containing protein [Lederbergia panacisoli]MCR2822275.1 DUF6220 domain-containing protein [Lederbergia panacisoli]
MVTTNKGNAIRRIFALLSLLFLIAIICQIFIAGVELFADSSQWAVHKSFVVYFEFIPIVMLVLAFFGEIPKKLRWHSLALYIMIALQYMTVGLSGKFPYKTALHPVIAMLLFWLSIVVLRTSLALVKTNKSRS